MCMLLAAGAAMGQKRFTFGYRFFNILFKKLRTEFVKKPADAGRMRLSEKRCRDKACLVRAQSLASVSILSKNNLA